MATTYIVFDSKSGQILAVHHGAPDAKHARERAQEHSKISRERVDVISVPTQFAGKGKSYKVDVARKALVEVPKGEPGVGFGFGHTGTVTSRS